MPTAHGARETPLTGLVARFTNTARTAISSMNPTTWFGPWQPLKPMAPQEEDQGVKGRRWDYSTGLNLNYIPRSGESINFGQLRSLADNCDILRTVIEARKDQIAGLNWVIHPRRAPAGGSPSDYHMRGLDAHPQLDQATKDRIASITQFFQYPDRESTWDQWQRQWLEDVLVIDAPTMWRRRQRDGKLHSLELLDGATIKPLLGADGRRPAPPDPAYQQILHGIPAADFTSEELLYAPWNPRTNHLYGYSKVEQILVTINTSIRRSLFQLNYYTEGSQPDAFVGLPKEWTMGNIKDFQTYMDDLLSGNLALRRKIRFVPGEFKYQETKPLPLKDTFDEFLARVICFCFGVAPDPFIEHVSRGAVEKSHTRAMEEGLAPTQKYIKAVIDRIILEDFNSPDLEFKYVEDLEHDQQKLMEIDTGYVKAGIFAIDEVRVARGKPPAGGPAAYPMLATTSGYVPLGALSGPGAAQAIAGAGGPAAQALVGRNRSTTGQDKTKAPKRNKPGSTPSTSSAPASKGAMVDISDADVKGIQVRALLKVLADEQEDDNVELENPIQTDLPIASDIECTYLNHQVWHKIQQEGFKFVNVEAPMSLLVATQTEVDEDRVAVQKQLYETDGYKWPPVVVEMYGKYYILEGHTRTIGAKEAGATSLVVAVLSDNDEDDVGHYMLNTLGVSQIAHTSKHTEQ